MVSRKDLAPNELATRNISGIALEPACGNDALAASTRPHGSHPEAFISRQGVVRTYRRYAPVYDWVFGAVLQPGRRALTAAVRDLNPGSVLEVGVGTGLTLGDYPASCRLVGIDFCEAMLSLARSRARTLAPRAIQLEVMDAEEMRFPDESFDCVTVPYVLSVTPNPDRLISEIRRVCRPAGIILIVNHFSGSRFWRLFEASIRKSAQRIGFRSDFAFEQHILRHDWQVIEMRRVNLFGLSRLVTLRNA
jgi:phosphatidylethanolamine/phosphatidyl-N-methylethanolamine N-methyltransferase